MRLLKFILKDLYKAIFQKITIFSSKFIIFIFYKKIFPMEGMEAQRVLSIVKILL